MNGNKNDLVGARGAFVKDTGVLKLVWFVAVVFEGLE